MTYFFVLLAAERVLLQWAFMWTRWKASDPVVQNKPEQTSHSTPQFFHGVNHTHSRTYREYVQQEFGFMELSQLLILFQWKQYFFSLLFPSMHSLLTQFPVGMSSNIGFCKNLTGPEVPMPHYSFANQSIKLFSADTSKDLQSREQHNSSCKHSPKDWNTMC